MLPSKKGCSAKHLIVKYLIKLIRGIKIELTILRKGCERSSFMPFFRHKKREWQPGPVRIRPNLKYKKFKIALTLG